jgi:hypothetical protein
VVHAPAAFPALSSASMPMVSWLCCWPGIELVDCLSGYQWIVLVVQT